MHIDNFDHYVVHRKRRSRRAKRDSGGVIANVRNEIPNGVKCINLDSNEVLWLLLDKSYFGLKRNVMLCLCYIPPDNSSSQKGTGDDKFEIIADGIAQYGDKYDCDFLVCGDFNGRTDNLPDYVIHDETDFLPLPDDYIQDIDIDSHMRVNKDTTVNQQVKMCQLRIANGRMCADAGCGDFTCVTYNGKSVVDYVVGSPSLLKNFNVFTVLPQTVFSDHCPVQFSLCATRVNNKGISASHYYKMIWDENEKENFVQVLSSETTKSSLDEMDRFTKNVIPSKNTVNQAVALLVDALRNAADPLFLKSMNTLKSTGRQGRQMQDPGVQAMKKKIYKANDRYRAHPSDSNREIMVTARSAYKSAALKSKHNHEVSQTSKLLKAKMNNVKMYWKLLSSCGEQRVRTNVTNN